MSQLAERIQERLDALNMTARRASLEAGLSAGAVGKMLSGESSSPRAKNLQSLATVLRCDPAYLLGQKSEPGLIKGPVEGHPVIKILGEAKAGSWGEVDMPMEGSGVLFIRPMEEFSPELQFGILVADRHMEALIPQDAVVHILKERPPSPLRDGDIVLISRKKFSGKMAEITLRQVETAFGGARLSTRFRTSSYNDVVLFKPESSNPWIGEDEDGEIVDVLGRAVRAYLQIGGPSLFERDDDERRLRIEAYLKKLKKRD